MLLFLHLLSITTGCMGLAITIYDSIDILGSLESPTSSHGSLQVTTSLQLTFLRLAIYYHPETNFLT